MMALEKYHTIYFVGIGGIGMSALARWFRRQQLVVAGYDRTSTALTDALVNEGMQVHFSDTIASIPSQVLEDVGNTLVVYTPAVPSNSVIMTYLKDRGYVLMKRSEVLGMITNDFKTIAVAGTHGKTTTSSMIAHILHEADMEMVAFLGGITANYDSNLVMQGNGSKRTLVVAEADEYDRSFLRLFPQIAVVTSADADHLDIYGDHEHLTMAFLDFIAQINSGGSLVIHESINDRLTGKNGHFTRYTYGMSRGQFFAANITAVGGFFEFDLNGFEAAVRIRLGVPGFHNIENAIAASVAASLCGVTLPTLVSALESFRGVKRRFEYILKTGRVVFVDDYAHHPTEIEAFLRSMKSLFPGKKLTVVFQPHLYTRTRDFADGFSKSLSLADEVYLMDIYPARELPIAGVDSDMLLGDITSPVKVRCNKGDVVSKLESGDLEVLATVGAGDIDAAVEPIKNMLMRKYEI
jgi:UDP-N-acetylmuramate--alanine ligase